MPFIAAVQTSAQGQPVLACFARMPFTKQAMADFAAKSLVRPLSVVSDGLPCFLVAREAGAHEQIITGGGSASAKLPQLRAVNTVLSNLKTSLGGSHHAINFVKYGYRYLAEAQYRFNRRFDLGSILMHLMRAARQNSANSRSLDSAG